MQTIICKTCLKVCEKKKQNRCEACYDMINERKNKKNVIINNENVQNNNQMIINNENFQLIKSAINNFFSVYKYKGLMQKSFMYFFKLFKKKLKEFLNQAVNIMPIKYSISIDYIMISKKLINNEFKIKEFLMTKNTDKIVINNINYDKNRIFANLRSIMTDMFEGCYNESGLSFDKVDEIRININPYIVGKGSSYIELPDKINKNNSCLNIKNLKDNKCFLWCLIAYLKFKNININDNKYRLVTTYKKYENDINMSNVKYPISLNDIINIELNNNLTINVYGLYVINGEYIISLLYPNNRINEIENKDRHINLLLYKNHYVLITDLNRLFYICITGKNSAYVCIFCGISIFTNEKALDNHKEKCKFKFKFQKYIISDKMNVKFKNYCNMIECPFIIYGDFESYFEVDLYKWPNGKNKNTEKIEFKKLHKPMGFMIKTICRSDEIYNNEYIYSGINADNIFVNELVKEIKRIENIINNDKKIIMNEEDWDNYNKSNICFLCNKYIKNDDKVRDHNHINGKYRGVAHKKCNLNYTKKSYVIPIVFHNLEGYDIHLFIDEIGKVSKGLEIIPKSKEKYITLIMKIKNSKIKLRFIDSLHFISGSLSDNAKKLSKFKYIPEEYQELRNKQYFPYNYFTNLNKLYDTQLPIDKESWYNELKKENIKDDELEYAKMIYNKYNCKTLKDYTELYLKSDVNLLCEIFENFRDLSLKTYQLDPAWYFTTPGFSWDAALKYSKIKLELLKDREIIDFFIEKGTMRGGISTVCRKKYSISNNKYMDDYNENELSRYIMYFDVTNLYGYTMSDYLPTGGFKWLDNPNNYINNMNELYKDIDTNISYILEIDLEYPKELKDKHIEIPLAPEHYDGKLSPNLYDKYNYKLRIENLKYYLENGLILKKIHRILKFRQSKWLKDYIEMNTRMRKDSKDESAKNFYKLMNNAVYGKTMENVFGRKNFKLISSNDKMRLIKYTKMNEFKKEHILSNDLILLELEKADVIFNKPIYIGFSILELSKLHMYRLHYDLIKKKYNDKAILMYMDTDSLIYDIETNDVYNDLNEMKSYFDLSTYDKNFICYNDENKGKLGTLKDEYNQFISINGKMNINLIKEFICLKSKCYSLKLLNDKETKKCKGIMYSELSRLKHENFIECNETDKIFNVQQSSFKTVNHNIYTINLSKEGLSSLDNKRISIDRIWTVPLGYYQ